MCFLGDQFRLRPSLGHQHLGHIAEVITVVTVGPNLWSLREKHAVAECADDLAFGASNAQQLSSHSLRLLQLLPAGDDQGVINAVILQRQGLIGVEVLHPVPVQAWIGLQLLSIEPMTDHLLVALIVG